MHYSFRLSPIVSFFLSLTWLSACISYLFSAGGTALLQGYSLPEIAMLAAGVGLPLILLRAYTVQDQRKTVGGISTSQYEDILARIEALHKVQILPESTEGHLKAITQTFQQEARAFNGVTEDMLANFGTMTAQLDEQRKNLDAFATEICMQTERASSLLSEQKEQLIENKVVIDELVDSVDDATERAQQATNELVLKLSEPIAAVQERVEQGLTQLASMVDDLGDQLDEVETAFTATRDFSTQTSQDVRGQIVALASATQDNIDKLDTLEQNIARQVQDISKLGTVAQQSSAEIAQVISDNQYYAGELGQEMLSQAGALTQAIRDSGDGINELNAALSVYSREVGKDIDRQLVKFYDISDKAVAGVRAASHEAAGLIRDVYDQQSGIGSRLTKELTGKLERMTDAVAQRFDGLCNSGQEITSLLGQNVEQVNRQLSDQVRSVDVMIEGRTAELRQEIQNLSTAMERSTDGFVEGFERKFRLLDDKRDELASMMSKVGEQSAQTMEMQLGSALQRFEGKVTHLGERTRLELDSLLAGYSQKMGHSADETFNRLSTLSEKVPALVARFTEAAELAAQKFEELDTNSNTHRQSLRAMVNEFDVIAGDISQRLVDLSRYTGDQLHQTSSNFQNFYESSRQEQAKLTQQLEVLSLMGERFEQASLSFSEAVDKRFESLNDASTKTNDMARLAEQQLLSLADSARQSLTRCQKQAGSISQSVEGDMLRLDTISSATLERLHGFHKKIDSLQETLKDIAVLADTQGARLIAQGGA